MYGGDMSEEIETIGGDDTRICPKCGRCLPVSAFYVSISRRDGEKWKYKCKQCHRDIVEKSRARNIDKYKEASRRRYERNKGSIRLMNRVYRSTVGHRYWKLKQGAKERGLEWKITLDEIKNLGTSCHYTGMDLTFEIGKPNTFSVDRIDNSRGYTIDNVVPCAVIVNRMKSDLDVEDFYILSKMVSEHCVWGATIEETGHSP
jgi:predicted SprT family Zn-dependent metalloprotease